MKKYLNQIKNKGYVILENIYDKKQTTNFKKKLKKVLLKRIKKNERVGSPTNQVIYNYFNDDPYLLRLIYQKKIDKILTKLLDKDYVLQSSNAQNRLINSYKIKKNKKNFGIGSSWHTDSRYLGGKRLHKGFSYLVIIALDSFNLDNGPTKFIPKSIDYLKKPPRKIIKNINKNKIQNLIMNEGSVCIMDTGTWHKAGESSNNSRWSIFSIYSGWFVKPYFNYKPLTKKKIGKIYKKLLHDYSTPPEMNEKRTYTVRKFN